VLVEKKKTALAALASATTKKEVSVLRVRAKESWRQWGRERRERVERE
jgi:hypothetical protein